MVPFWSLRFSVTRVLLRYLLGLACWSSPFRTIPQIFSTFSERTRQCSVALFTFDGSLDYSRQWGSRTITYIDREHFCKNSYLLCLLCRSSQTFWRNVWWTWMPEMPQKLELESRLWLMPVCSFWNIFCRHLQLKSNRPKRGRQTPRK